MTIGLTKEERDALDFAIAGRGGCPSVAIPGVVERIIRGRLNAQAEAIAGDLYQLSITRPNGQPRDESSIRISAAYVALDYQEAE